MSTGYSLLLKGSVQPRFGKSDQLEVKVNTIFLLSEVKEQMIRNISISIPAASITDELIEEMKLMINNGEGKVALKLRIYDPEEKIGVDMFSRSKKVSLSDEFIEFLDSYSELDYKVS